MRWWLLIFVQVPIILTKNVRHTREARDCCPCPKDAEIPSINPTHNEERLSSNSGDDGDCICPPRFDDSEPAAATDSLRNSKSILRNSLQSKDNAKPLLHPEVDLASSVLHTLQKATDEEYHEALERDAARNSARESTSNGEQPEANLVTIVLNTPDIYDMDTAGEESKTQETRCAPLHLGNELTLNKPKTNILGDLFKPIKVDMFDQGLATSNVKSNIVPSNLASSKWFPELKILELGSSPIVNRFTEAQTGRNSVNRPKSFMGEINKFTNTADSDIGASNNNEVVIRNPINCDDPKKSYKLKLRDNQDPSKFSLSSLSQLHEANLKEFNNKLQDGHEKIANFLLEPFKNSNHNVNVQIEPMKLDSISSRHGGDKELKALKYRSQDSECDPNNQFEIITKLDNKLAKGKSNNNINNVYDLGNGNNQATVRQKQLQKQKNRNSLHDDYDHLTFKKAGNDFDLEEMSNTLLEKSIKMESKNVQRNDIVSQLACDHESLSKKHMSDASEEASEKMIKTVPFTSDNCQDNVLNNQRNNLVVQPDSIGENSQLYNINNPLKLELPSLEDIRHRMDNSASSLFNIKNPLALELPLVDDIREKLKDGVSLFNINNQNKLGLPTVDDIRQRLDDGTALFDINRSSNLGLQSVDDIREKLEDSTLLFTKNSPIKAELPNLGDINDRLEDSLSLFTIQNPLQLQSLGDIREIIEDRINVNNPLNLDLPSVDDIRDKLEDVSLFNVNNPINLELPHVDEIKDKIEDFFSLTSDLQKPSLNFGRIKAAANEPDLKFELPPLKLSPKEKGFNLDLPRLKPVLSSIGNERGVLNTGLNLNSFKTTSPEFKELSLKPLTLGSLRDANKNIAGPSLSLKDIDSHFKKIKSNVLQSQLKQLKGFKNKPKTIEPTISTPGIGNKKQSSNVYKTIDFNPFENRQRPLKASIQVPSLKLKQSQGNIVTTPKISKLNMENAERIKEKYKTMDPIMKAAIVNTLTNTKISEPTAKKSYSTHILKNTKSDTFKRILNNDNGFKSLEGNKLKTLKEINSLRQANLDLLDKSLLDDPLNLFTKKEAPISKTSSIRQRINKAQAKQKENTIKSLGSPKTIKLTSKHDTLKLENPQNNLKKYPSNKNRVKTNSKKPITDIKSKIYQLHLSQDNDEKFSKLSAMPSLRLPTLNKPLSLTQDAELFKLDNLFGAKKPKITLPNNLLLPQANLNSITWPKDILNLSDLRSSDDTIRPVTICSDNDVGSSNNVDVVKSINTNNRATENRMKSITKEQPYTQRNELENQMTFSNEDNLEPVTQLKSRETPILDKLRESIKTSFDELNNRVNDNIKRFSKKPKVVVDNCAVPESGAIVEPTNAIETSKKPDLFIEEISVEKKSLEVDPCQPKAINSNNHNSIVFDDNSQLFSDENDRLDTDNEGIQSDEGKGFDNMSDNDNSNNSETHIYIDKNNELHDSIVEPTNIEQNIADNEDLNQNHFNNVFMEPANTKQKSSDNCEVVISKTPNNEEQTKPIDVEATTNKQKIIEIASDYSDTDTLDSEPQNEQSGLLDNIHDQFETSIKSPTYSNTNKIHLLPFTNKAGEETEFHRPIIDRKQSDTKPLNEEIVNLLERIKSSFQFKKNSDSKEKTGKYSDSTDSEVEASNNIPLIERMHKPKYSDSFKRTENGKWSDSTDSAVEASNNIPVVERMQKPKDIHFIKKTEKEECSDLADSAVGESHNMPVVERMPKPENSDSFERTEKDKYSDLTDSAIEASNTIPVVERMRKPKYSVSIEKTEKGKWSDSTDSSIEASNNLPVVKNMQKPKYSNSFEITEKEKYPDSTDLAVKASNNIPDVERMQKPKNSDSIKRTEKEKCSESINSAVGESNNMPVVERMQKPKNIDSTERTEKEKYSELTDSTVEASNNIPVVKKMQKPKYSDSFERTEKEKYSDLTDSAVEASNNMPVVKIMQKPKNSYSIKRTEKEKCSDSTDSAVGESYNMPLVERMQKPKNSDSLERESSDSIDSAVEESNNIPIVARMQKPKNDDSIEITGKEEGSDFTDSAVEALINTPVVDKMQKPKEIEFKMTPNVSTNDQPEIDENQRDLEPKEEFDCVPLSEKSLDLPSSICGKGIPVDGNVSYKCRLVCTKE